MPVTIFVLKRAIQCFLLFIAHTHMRDVGCIYMWRMYRYYTRQGMIVKGHRDHLHIAICTHKRRVCIYYSRVPQRIGDNNRWFTLR